MQNYFENKIRVRYGETDQMGVVYYGNYALYLEQARTEMLRAVGYTYKKLEEENVFLPVVNLNIRYRKSVLYDELISVRTIIKGLPNRKIIFESELYNEKEELLAACEVILVFLDEKQRIIRCPLDVKNALAKYTQN